MGWRTPPTVQDASTAQSSDGSILVNTVLGGTAPYDYLWSPGGSTSANLEGIPAGTYTLTLTDERGCEAVQVFEVKYVLGTGDALSGGMLLLYPNPAGASVTLAADFGSEAPMVLELFDASGRRVQSSALSSPGNLLWQVSLEGLVPGAYLANLKDGLGKIMRTGRLIKL